MYVTSGIFHDLFYIVTSLANHMGMFCVRYIHFQCHSVTLKQSTVKNSMRTPVPDVNSTMVLKILYKNTIGAGSSYAYISELSAKGKYRSQTRTQRSKYDDDMQTCYRKSIATQ